MSFIHIVSIKDNRSDDSIKKLLVSKNIIDDKLKDNCIYTLNFNEYLLESEKSDCRKDCWNVWFSDKNMFYYSKFGNDDPIYYISKLIREITFIEELCNNCYECRTWLNGKCINYRMTEYKGEEKT